MWETICQFSLLVPMIAYFSLRYYYNYWQRKKIACVESNVLDFDWYKLPAIEYHAKIYRQLDGHKFGGCYMRFTPKLMVRDPDLIRRILIEDFDRFHDRGDVIFDENEPITMHLFTASGDFWRNLRTNLTPAFASDKIKFMFKLIEECSQELSEVIGNEIKMDDFIDVKDFSTRYTIDVIASCAFGLKARTVRDGKSLFKLMASKIFRRSWAAKLMIFSHSTFPRLKKKFGFSVSNKSANEFFFKTIEETVGYREKNGVNRNDFLQLLIDLRNQQELGEFVMTNEIMTAQCFLFFIAGHDSSIMALSGALYEIAANTQIQNRLQEEIDTNLKKYDDKVNFEMVNNMPYLHQVFSETLRKYPALGALNRVCVENYQIPDTEVIIEKDTEILIPVSGLHWDPKYFPDPEKFDPDRFEDPGKLPCRDIYLPFGAGPRNCIGSRFALFGVKVALICLLRDFRFEICSKTKYPFEFERLKISTSVKHEIVLRCSRK